MRSKAIIAIVISLALAYGFIHNQVRSHSLIHIKENNLPLYLQALLISILVFLSCYSFGNFLLSKRFQGSFAFAVPTAIGLVALGFSIFVCGFLHALIFPFVIAVLAILLASGIRGILSWIRSVADFRSESLCHLEAGFLALIVFTLLVCLVNSLAPITANDALVYHLTVPKIYVEKGQIQRLPFNVYANMPHFGELIYTACLALGGQSGASLFYFLLLLITCIAIYDLSKQTSRFAAIVATGGFLVQPLLIDSRVICNVDILLALVSIAAISILLKQESKGLADTILFGVLCGFAIGIKYTALGIVLGLLIGYAMKSGIRRMMLSGLIALAVFSPWLAKNFLFVRNPLYPMFEGIFDGLNWDKTQLKQLIAWQRSMGMGRSLIDYILLPINVFTAGRPGLNYSRFDGTITPVLLVLVVFSLFKPQKRILIPSLISFIFWALTSQQMRFLVPTLAMLAIPAANGIEYLREKCSRLGFAILSLILLLIEASSLVLPDQYGKPVVSNAICDRLPVVLGLETKNQFLERMVQPFSMFSYINRNIPKDERILMVWENRAFYLDRDYLADSFFEASTLMRWVEESASPESLAKRIREGGFRYVLVNNMLGQVFARFYPPASVKILVDFINDHLKPIHSVNNITLYELLESPTGYSQEP